MSPYTVIYTTPEDKFFWEFFLCHAKNEDHAEEQCFNAYPSCAVLWVNEGHGPDSHLMEGLES